MRKLIKVLVVCLTGLGLLACGSSAEPQPAEQPAGEEKQPEAEIAVQNYGVITIDLFPEQAPETVKNFIALAESGFYDGLTFHRIIPRFMIQGGDPNGNGTGGSGTTIPGEFSSNDFDNTLLHLRGTLSMARAIDPNSASSQFFICVEDSPHLDGDYAAFGTVSEGMDVVDQIVADARPVDGNGTILPEQQPVIESIRIIYR